MSAKEKRAVAAEEKSLLQYPLSLGAASGGDDVVETLVIQDAEIEEALDGEWADVQDITELLVRQLGAVQDALTNNHQIAIRRLSKIYIDNRRLNAENEVFRNKLQSVGLSLPANQLNGGPKSPRRQADSPPPRARRANLGQPDKQLAWQDMSQPEDEPAYSTDAKVKLQEAWQVEAPPVPRDAAPMLEAAPMPGTVPRPVASQEGQFPEPWANQERKENGGLQAAHAASDASSKFLLVVPVPSDRQLGAPFPDFHTPSAISAAGGAPGHYHARKSAVQRGLDQAKLDSALASGDSATQMREPRVFADAAAMKEKLKAAIGRPVYNVADNYFDEGIWQQLARNGIFENTTLFVIFFNALWLAVDTDGNEADMLLDAEPVYQFAENFFCTYFTFEWFVRWKAFRHKRDGLKDAWFVFDGSLMVIMIAETWVLTAIIYFSGAGQSSGLGNLTTFKLIRLVRLTRTARMARLLRAMPELMIMIKGMAVAMRSVFFTLFLLLCIVYVFSIVFVQLMGPRGAFQPLSEDWDPTKFPDVVTAMNTLLMDGALPDEAVLVNLVGNESFVTRIVIMIFVLLAGLTVMNMLVGVLCEVVSVVSAVEKEALLVNFVKTQISEMLKTSGLDANGDNKISRDEFESLLEMPAAARALNDVGVDVIGLVDYTDFIFDSKDTELGFQDFMDVVLQLRGSNQSTVRDIVDLRKLMIAEFSKLCEEVVGGIQGDANHMNARALVHFEAPCGLP